MHTNGMKGEKTYLLQAPEDLKYYYRIYSSTTRGIISIGLRKYGNR